MAAKEDVYRVRELADYRDVDPYDDTQLSAMIDASSVEDVVARLWEAKAAQFASMVNVSESGSSRSLGDAYKNALSMATHFHKKAQEAETPVDEGRYARTRAAVREG